MGLSERVRPDIGDEDEAHSPLNERFRGHPLPAEPPVFAQVSDRDLITLADVLCRSLEFHSMLVAWKVIHEVSTRELWPAVIKRRADSLRRANPDMHVEKAREIAERDIHWFRDEHFPVEPEHFGSDPGEAEQSWNGYIQF
jgi:hypothetical protein